MGAHLIEGQFQSDKYPWCQRGFVPLKVTDASAQPMLWAYAQVRRAVDAEFADDLEKALIIAGHQHIEDPPEAPATEIVDAIVDPKRVALWDAINEYAASCGGDTSHNMVSGRRMDAVVRVENAIRSILDPEASEITVFHDGTTRLPRAMMRDLGIEGGGNLWFLKGKDRWEAWREDELESLFGKQRPRKPVDNSPDRG